MIFVKNIYKKETLLMRHFYLILLFVCYGVVHGQEIIIVDNAKNPITNVSVFNQAKTKSTLSNKEGIVNLSRFLSNDTIFIQHPNYKATKLVKSSILDFIELETEYNLLNNIVISERKNLNNIKNDAAKKIYITHSDIPEFNARTTADLLEKKGGVSVQMSQMGGGSPNIRGFEASRVLLVLDGVRLNNAIYRSGHLQNIITIDEHIFEDVEIIFGPSSVLYGSDAIGGIINMSTKDLYFKSNNEWGGSMFSNYNSIYNGSSHNLSLSFESKNYSAISSFSFKNFGDLKMGSYRPHGYEDWGLVHHYVDKNDSIMCNPNPEIQKGTSYHQYDLFNKMMFKISDNARITSNIQYSNSSNIPRFDQLNDGNLPCELNAGSKVCLAGEELKFHSYYYGPQTRFFSSLDFTLFDTYFEKTNLILGYQKIKESRHKWKLKDFLAFNPETDVNSDLDMTSQYETVNVYSANINLRRGSVFLGSETIYNNVDSRSNSSENVHSIEDTRYPSKGSNLFSTALYFNVFKRLSHKIQLESGLRYTFSILRANYPSLDEQSGADLYNLLNENSSLSSGVLSGNIKLIYFPSDSWKISSVTSRGFHAPNIDDMFKVHLKSVDDNYRLTVPYKGLKPEYSLSQEISITKDFDENFTIYGTGFFTRLANAIILDTLFRDAGVEGIEHLVSTVYYDGVYPTTFANQNSKEIVNIYGVTLGFNANIYGFKVSHDINITKYLDNDGDRGHFAHIPPLFGKLEILKNIDRWKFRFSCLFSGSKNNTEFDDADVDNLSETPVIGETIGSVGAQRTYAGLPGWYTINSSVQYSFQENLKLQFSVDNILDAHYKTFGSGISAPGRSLILSVYYNF